MSCFYPLTGWQGSDGRVVFTERLHKDVVRQLQLSCGQCVGCRLERSRQWAVRCMHEASLHEANCFVTLTYEDDAVTSLEYRDFQLFMKRMRKFFCPQPVRFYMCGEYGEEFGRPHFHACLFGVDFVDKREWRRGSSGAQYYRSHVLERLWRLGHSEIGEVTFESAGYVARYIMKKIMGEDAEVCYDGKTPEFSRMSLKPGIGENWLRLYWPEVAQAGMVVARGVEGCAPRYYMKKLSKLEAFERIAQKRHESAVARFADSSVERLRVREMVAEARLKLYKRELG